MRTHRNYSCSKARKSGSRWARPAAEHDSKGKINAEHVRLCNLRDLREVDSLGLDPLGLGRDTLSFPFTDPETAIELPGKCTAMLLLIGASDRYVISGPAM